MGERAEAREMLDAPLEVERVIESGGVGGVEEAVAGGVHGFAVATGVVSRETGGIFCSVVWLLCEAGSGEVGPRCGEC